MARREAGAFETGSSLINLTVRQHHGARASMTFGVGEGGGGPGERGQRTHGAHPLIQIGLAQVVMRTQGMRRPKTRRARLSRAA